MDLWKKNVVWLWHNKSSPSLGAVRVLGGLSLGIIVQSPLRPPYQHCWTMFKSRCLQMNSGVQWHRLYVLMPTGCCPSVSAVSQTVTDVRWKHTWSLSYVLLNKVLLHHARPYCKATILKIKVHMWLYAHTSKDKGVRYHLSSKGNVSACVWIHIYVDTRAHTQCEFILDTLKVVGPVSCRLHQNTLYMVNFHCSISLQLNQRVPSIKVNTSTLLHHHLEWKGYFFFFWSTHYQLLLRPAHFN